MMTILVILGVIIGGLAGYKYGFDKAMFRSGNLFSAVMQGLEDYYGTDSFEQAFNQFADEAGLDRISKRDE